MKNVYLQAFKAHGSKEDGYLSAIEKNTGLPFEIKRVYTVVDTKEGNIRGYHAHRKLHQVFFALTGKIIVKCENIYGEKEENEKIIFSLLFIIDFMFYNNNSYFFSGITIFKNGSL